jgi:hypothetical protein
MPIPHTFNNYTVAAGAEFPDCLALLIHRGGHSYVCLITPREPTPGEFWREMRNAVYVERVEVAFDTFAAVCKERAQLQIKIRAEHWYGAHKRSS